MINRIKELLYNRENKSHDKIMILGREEYNKILTRALDTEEFEEQAKELKEENDKLHRDIRLMPLPGDPRRVAEWERPFDITIHDDFWSSNKAVPDGPMGDVFACTIRFHRSDIARWYGKGKEGIMHLVEEVANTIIGYIQRGF